MGNCDTFALYIYHGGGFANIGEHVLYFGGTFVGRFDFDEDRFGYFDLMEEVENLGYVAWDGLYFKPLNTEIYKPLKDDSDVMQMLSHLSQNCRKFYIYVDNGKKVEEVEQDKVNVVQDNIVDVELNKLDGDAEICLSLQSESDSDYIPTTDDELTDDGLSDTELASEDEEYVTCRKKSKSAKIPKEVFDKYVGVTGVRDCIHDENLVREDCVSEYDDSDGDVNSSSTEDEFECVKKKKMKVTYDPKCDHKDLNVVLGMIFESGYQAKEALITCAISNGWHLRFKRVNKNQMEAKCTPPCNWRCYGSIIKGSHVFRISTVRGEHHCRKMMSNKLVTADWIANQYLNVFRVRPNMTVSDLKEDLLRRYSVYVTKSRLYRARKQAIERLRGSVDEHYSLLRRYLAELKRIDKEGRFELLLSEGAVFKGLFVGFSALQKGFLKGCRPIIGLDGAFLKTYLGGVLLSATAKDANNQMFPIAWAVVEVENQECWTWFLDILLQFLGINDGDGYTFISDQQKGLINVVRNLAPFAEHRNCARHVYCNWKKQHKGPTLKNMFWRACRSTYLEEYKLAIEDLKKENAAAFEDLIDRGPEKFCKTFISLAPKNDMITNNVAETFNGYIVNARGKHIIDMLEEIRTSLMDRQVVKYNLVNPNTDSICPNVRKKLEKLKVSSRYCTARPSMDGGFEVHAGQDKFVVILESRTCSCRVWDLTRIPCVYVICAIMFLRQDPACFVHEYYSARRYQEAYNYGLKPMNGEKMWPQAEGYPVLPPPAKKMPGRPKKKRVRDLDERNEKDPNKLKKCGVTMTCTRCLQTGHNIRSCKNDLVQRPPKEQKKRGRPAPKDPKDPKDPSIVTKRKRKEPTYASKGRLQASKQGTRDEGDPGNAARSLPTQESGC